VAPGALQCALSGAGRTVDGNDRPARPAGASTCAVFFSASDLGWPLIRWTHPPGFELARRRSLAKGLLLPANLAKVLVGLRGTPRPLAAVLPRIARLKSLVGLPAALPEPSARAGRAGRSEESGGAGRSVENGRAGRRVARRIFCRLVYRFRPLNLARPLLSVYPRTLVCNGLPANVLRSGEAADLVKPGLPLNSAPPDGRVRRNPACADAKRWPLARSGLRSERGAKSLWVTRVTLLDGSRPRPGTRPSRLRRSSRLLKLLRSGRASLPHLLFVVAWLDVRGSRAGSIEWPLRGARYGKIARGLWPPVGVSQTPPMVLPQPPAGVPSPPPTLVEASRFVESRRFVESAAGLLNGRRSRSALARIDRVA